MTFGRLFSALTSKFNQETGSRVVCVPEKRKVPAQRCMKSVVSFQKLYIILRPVIESGADRRTSTFKPITAFRRRNFVTRNITEETLCDTDIIHLQSFVVIPLLPIMLNCKANIYAHCRAVFMSFPY
jgi:hypothetical protein